MVDVDRVTGGCEAMVLFGSAGIILHAIDARQRERETETLRCQSNCLLRRYQSNPPVVMSYHLHKKVNIDRTLKRNLARYSTLPYPTPDPLIARLLLRLLHALQRSHDA